MNSTIRFSPIRLSSVARAATMTFGFIWASFMGAAQDKSAPPLPAKPAEAPASPSLPAPASALKWDALSKIFDAKPGEMSALFEFKVTNPSASAVSIESIQTSCGCTVAELPPLPAAPYVLAPGASTAVRVTLDLHGKSGVISKVVTVGTTAGISILTVQATVPSAPVVSGNAPGMGADRAKNIEIATHDRQAIFKGECAKCHATPAAGKMGQDLYRAVCTICHEAHPRASMIPDLNVPRGPRDLAFWNKWVAEGGAGTMMPAFAATHGGPLTEEQVASLALYGFADVLEKFESGSEARAFGLKRKSDAELALNFVFRELV